MRRGHNGDGGGGHLAQATGAGPLDAPTAVPRPHRQAQPRGDAGHHARQGEDQARQEGTIRCPSVVGRCVPAVFRARDMWLGARARARVCVCVLYSLNDEWYVSRFFVFLFWGLYVAVLP